MCGRTCLTLKPSELIINCCHKKPAWETIKEGFRSDDDISGELLYPVWHQINSSITYQPSYNIAPSNVTPVLVSGAHFNNVDENGETCRCLVPMIWGMIPFWHKGDYRKHGLSTNNCRLEHMLNSKMYSSPFRKGQRCVILCEGFYEWQTTITTKPSDRAAFYISMPQKNSSVEIFDSSTWKSPADVKLLKMAGIYNVWQDENGDKVYSYSVITHKSNKLLHWLHGRMPAILETDKQVDDWLDSERVKPDEALKILEQTIQSLKWYRVSNLVNNSREKNSDCNKPLRFVNKKKLAQNPIMNAWLNARKRKEAELAKISQNDDDEDYIEQPPFKRTRPH